MGRTILAATLTLLLAGCATGPLQENPLLIRTDKVLPHENPVYIPQGPLAYAKVFEKVIDVLDDYWEIAYANRYDGRIETHPRTSPGLEQPWRPGSPDPYQRLLASLQSIRTRCIVSITTADDGGYFIDVKVLKELEDIPSPVGAQGALANFQLLTTVERQFEVVEPALYESQWIPVGRDCALEQVILDRLARFDICEPVR